MRYNLISLFVVLCPSLVSCALDSHDKQDTDSYGHVLQLQRLNMDLESCSGLPKDSFISIVGYYISLEDSIAYHYVSHTDSAAASIYGMVSATREQVMAKLLNLADSCDWNLSDIPAFQAGVYGNGIVPDSSSYSHEAAVFFASLKPGTYQFSSWQRLAADYTEFFHRWSNSQVKDVNTFRTFLREENDLFTALLSSSGNSRSNDFVSIISGTEYTGEKVMNELVESGISPELVRSYMLHRTNHRLVLNSRYGLRNLCGSDSLSAEQFDLSLSLLISPFVYTDRELVSMRTAEQTSELERIGMSVPSVFEQYGSYSESRNIYYKDIPLLIIKRIITEGGM